MPESILAAVVGIIADGKVFDDAGQWLQPLQGFSFISRPIGVGDNADPESPVPRQFNSGAQ